jgi:hypothetical protein
MPTSALGFQSFYQTQLSSNITDTDTTIPVDTLPSPSQGILVLESTVPGKREIIYYTSKTSTPANQVLCPAGAGNGRGFDGTTATSHLQGSAVIMANVAAYWRAIQDGTALGNNAINTTNIANSAVTFAKLATDAKPGLKPSTTASTATLSPNLDSFNSYEITAQAVALAISNPSGTFSDKAVVMFFIKDNGTTRAITFGTNFVDISGSGMLVTNIMNTTAGKWHVIGAVYNATLTKWQIISITTEA